MEKTVVFSRLRVRRTVYAGVFLALAIVLPFFTGQVKILGKALQLMHLPVFLCGLCCGKEYGLAVGFSAPLMRSLTFGMPPLFPSAVAMAFELAAYAFFAGWFYDLFRRRTWAVYPALGLAMLSGRVIWGAVSFLLYTAAGSAFTFSLFVQGALVDASVGILLQWLLIPPVVLLLDRHVKKR